MPNDILWDAAITSLTSYETTDLNSIADGGNVLCNEIDFTAVLEPWLALSLYLAAPGSARDSGAYVAVYLLFDHPGLTEVLM